jgi:hypothetical protein
VRAQRVSFFLEIIVEKRASNFAELTVRIKLHDKSAAAEVSNQLQSGC